MRGIYKILIGNKIYYGSCNDFKVRKNSHKYHLNRDTHYNKYLQNLWNKYGDAEFTFIEEVTEDDLYKREQEIIDEHYNQPYCINLSPIAGGGRIHQPNEQTIVKGLATKARTGNWGGANENSWAAAAKVNTGIKRSDECKKKMSDAKKSFLKDNPDFYNAALDKGRANRWEKHCKSFYLVKEGVKHGPFKKQKEAFHILSSVSISQLYLGKKDTVKAFSLFFV